MTDASCIGISYILRQCNLLSKWRLVHCGSKALNGPESRYAACEIETLGIFFALIECKHYLVGMTEFTVLSDHKLLKGLFAKNLAAVDNIRM